MLPQALTPYSNITARFIIATCDDDNLSSKVDVKETRISCVAYNIYIFL